MGQHICSIDQEQFISQEALEIHKLGHKIDRLITLMGGNDPRL